MSQRKLVSNNYTHEKIPKHTEESALKKRVQRKEAEASKPSLFFGADFIVNDEKYFCFDGYNMHVCALHFTNDKIKAYRRFSFHGVEKFSI